MSKKALITGINGQDAAYLAKLLLDKGYEVHGTLRTQSISPPWRLQKLGIEKSVDIHFCSMQEYSLMNAIIHEYQFDEIYHLAAQTRTEWSFIHPEETMSVNTMSTLNLLDAIKNFSPKSKMFFASSAAIFGNPSVSPQDENTPFKPVTPYGVSKLAAHQLVEIYRGNYGLFLVNGILFNHESPLRADNYLTKKVVNYVKTFEPGKTEPLKLGNLDPFKDWGHSKDYVKAMHLMLQASKPEDYVLATGLSYSVRTFVRKCFELAGYKLTIKNEGKHLEEYATVRQVPVYGISDKYYRHTSAVFMQGNASKAHIKLQWQVEHTLEDVIKDMLEFS